MPALALAPVDLSSAAPQSTASNSAGHEGLFSSHLKNATDQQSTTASSSATSAAKQQRNRAQNAQGAKKAAATQPTDMAADTSATATNPNTPAKAATQTAAGQTAALPAGTAPTETNTKTQNMAVNPQAAGQQRESAMTKLLGRVAAGATAADNNGAPTGSQPQAQQTGQSSASQFAGDAAKARSAAAGAANANNPAMAASAAHGADPGQRLATGPTPAMHVAFHQAERGATQPPATATPLAAAVTTGQQADGQMQNGVAAIMQDTFSPFTGSPQSKAAGEESDDSASTGSATTVSEDRTVDFNGNYIRSRLPKDPTNTSQDSGSKQETQADSAAQAKQQQQKATPTAEAIKSAADSGQKPQAVTGPEETSSILFAGQQQATGPQPASIAPIASVSLHLPSGMTVPDSAVVDQMIAHFAANRQLETSTVTLRLYPSELGELRMEIKVAQDNIKAHIVAQTPLAQEMINRHLPRLREALEEQNLNLQQVEVSVAVHNQTSGGQFQESNAWQQSASTGRHAADQGDFTQEVDEAAGNESADNILSVLV